jgi:hypothetical protein
MPWPSAWPEGSAGTGPLEPRWARSWRICSIQLEAQQRGLNPTHQLIYSQPNSTVSPMPAAYVNMSTAVNMNNVVGASGTMRSDSRVMEMLTSESH